MKTILFPLLAAMALLALSQALVSAAPGDLDPTFGNGGKVTTYYGLGSSANLSLALQGDGKIVVATRDNRIARYNADGTLDASFGIGGIVNWGSYVAAIALQSDGKIIGEGQSTVVRRYNTNGTVDAGFGSGGSVDFGFFIYSLIHLHCNAMEKSFC